MAARLVTVFMGTPRFAVPALRALANATDLRLVVTQPDRPAGRGRVMEPPPVKVAALDLGLEVIQPEVVKGRRFAELVARLSPDVLVTAAFGRILGPALLRTPRLGCLNVHASILPAYRGAAPVNRAIAAGERVTGVSVMAMEEGLDSGPVYGVALTEIDPDETAGELTERLAGIGAAKLVEVLDQIEVLEPIPQDHARATYAPPLEKADGVIDWARPAARVHDLIRGVHPWPCATTALGGQILKVHRAILLRPSGAIAPAGRVVAHGPDGIDVACLEGAVRLCEVQLPGKRKLPADAFYAGRKLEIGSVLGR